VDRIRSSRLVAADVASQLIGPVGVTFVGVTVMLSTFGTLTASLLTAPRIFFAMADDGLLPRRVGAVHATFRTPHVAILICMALGVGFVLLRTFEQLADTFVTAIVPFYALGVAAVFTLRKRADYAPGFRVPWYPVVPSLFVVSHDLPAGQCSRRPVESLGHGSGAGRGSCRNPCVLCGVDASAAGTTGPGRG